MAGAAVLLLVGAGLTPAAADTTAPVVRSAAAPLAHGFGAQLPTTGPTVAPDVRTYSAAALPASVDLRRYAVPVGDQGQVNSCVAWAVAHGMMGWYANKYGQTTSAFAPMYVYSQINVGRSEGADLGSYPVDGFVVARTQGVAPSVRYPQGDYNWWSQPTAAERAQAAKHRGFAFKTLFASRYGGGGPGRNAIKSALAAGSPVFIAFPVRDGFYNLYSGNPSVIPTDFDASSPVMGGHAVLALGYDATGLIVQNQWGTYWGGQGYGRLAWNVVDHDVQEAETMSYTPPALQGHLDAAGSIGGGRVLVKGWAYDPMNQATSVRVDVYEGSLGAGHGRGSVVSSLSSPDINRIFQIGGKHRYSGTVAATAGTHQYQFWATNGPNHTLIGTSTVKVAAPTGHLDSISAVSGGKLRLSGWAFDPGTSSTAITVQVYEGSFAAVHRRSSSTTNAVRADVNRKFGIAGAHGLTVDLPMAAGKHTYTVYAVNGSLHTLLGSSTVVIK